MILLRFNVYLSEADSDWKAQDQYEVIQFVHKASRGEEEMRVNVCILGKHSTSHNNCLRINHMSGVKVPQIECL